MASREVNGDELLEVDICDSIYSEAESGVFVNSAASFSDSFSAFQKWSAISSHGNATVSDCSNDTSSQTHCEQEVLNGSANAEAEETGCYSDTEGQDENLKIPRTSIVDCLLVELYDTYSSNRRSVDSLDSSTEASSSDAFFGRSNTGSSFLQELQEKHTRRHQMNYLAQKAPEQLRWIIQEVKYRTGLQSTKLLRQLRRRDRLYHKLQKNYDIITACLQAVSQKRRVDTRLKFTLEPSLGKNGFQQWYDALKAVARLPTGIPKEWRKRVWLTLADQYLHSISIDWEKTLRFAFNERSNPDDDSLGIQIVKDLHRTGCSSYCGQEGEQDRVVLKRVLLAYARWNKTVGYCQGFNVLAALILEVTEGSESDALKVMIYLIDKVLPESYFANNLRALSVDMAVFRDLLRLKLPRLSQHLHHLQKAANREAGGSYEPPLTNVFTMQWFLTMFATCLPPATVLKIWDSVFFEGSEVLLRVALAIWERLGERIEYCQTADEFYSTMGCLTQEMLEHSLIEPTDMMQEVYSMAVFPFPQLAELREKYTYNITPFPTSVKANGSSGLGGWDSDDDADMDEEDSVVTALGCLGPLGGLLAPELQRYQKHLKDQSNIGELSPGAVGAGVAGRAEHRAAINSMMEERMSTDIWALKKQYCRIKRRQQQQATQVYIRTDKCPATSVLASQLNPSSPVVNHLLLGRRPRTSRASLTHGPPSPGLRPAALPQSPASSPSRPQAQSCPAQMGSPWRAHVRSHRRNVARARAQLGFGDPEDQEEVGEEPGICDRRSSEKGGEKRGGGGGGEAEEEEERKEVEVEEERRKVSPLPLSPSQSSLAGAGEEVGEVEEGLASLELVIGVGPAPPTETEPIAALVVPPFVPEATAELGPPPAIPILPPPPSTRRRESDSSGSESGRRSLRRSPSTPLTFSSIPLPLSSSPSTPLALSSSASSTPQRLPSSPSSPSLSPDPPFGLPSAPTASYPSTPTSLEAAPHPSRPLAQQGVFSPFPCVKQPRKSPAARNLGLYGPTPRTPTVHFPQLSLGRSSASATTRRR
ncbi:TBC1 domain family member 30 isoform X3 [Osmerus eperlanus]|uniref:TBC1 domain family member 30 isoform X3 n=1 Tax=Osmerus eperlanus TaxID=29151 RepID=UPI002E0DCEBE